MPCAAQKFYIIPIYIHYNSAAGLYTCKDTHVVRPAPLEIVKVAHTYIYK